MCFLWVLLFLLHIATLVARLLFSLKLLSLLHSAISNTITEFTHTITNIPGVALGYIGIGLTYLFATLLQAKLNNKSPIHYWLIAALSIAAIAFISIAIYLVRGNELRIDINSPLVLAFLGVATGLLCGALSAQHHKKISWGMFGISLFFLTISLILLFTPV